MRRDVYTVHARDKVRDVLNLFVEKHVSGVPVVDDRNNLVGIITDADILRQVHEPPSFLDFISYIVFYDGEAALEGKIQAMLEEPVRKLMTTDVITVTEDTGLSDVAQILSRRRFKKVPVVQGRKLVGIISRSDVVRYLVREFLKKGGGERSSRQI
nr:CBS domain-containing protein [Desulfofundulus thermobenzoicus]